MRYYDPASQIGISHIHNAKEAFRRLYAQALRHKRWSVLLGSCDNLLNLNDVPRCAKPGQVRSYTGIRLVPLAQIRGTEGRRADFDANFRPLHRHIEERWIRVAMARDEGIPLPAVELIQIGESYFVRDGHHRVSVAKMMRQSEIEAEVTVWC